MKFAIIFSIVLTIVSVDSDSKTSRINEIRKSVLSYFTSNPNLAYKSDIELVANKDWLIEKYIETIYKSSDPDKQLIESLKAWKADAILELNDTSFPSELYALGHWFDFGVARDGSPMIGVDLVCAPPLSKIDSTISELARKFIRYIARKVIYRVEDKNYYIYTDLNTPKLIEIDIATVIAVVKTHTLHNPTTSIKAVVYKWNAALISVLKPVVSALIPSHERLFSFPNTENELESLFSMNQVPVHLGGRNKSFTFIPEGVRSVKCKHLPQFNQNSVDRQNWENLKDLRIDCYLNRLQLSGKSSLEEFLREC